MEGNCLYLSSALPQMRKYSHTPSTPFPWSFLDRFGWGGNGGYETIWELMEKEQKERGATDGQKESQAVD